ncbi:polymer-forming cytoskeletal protein [Terrilactibacillus laevilacticus]|uniref:Polymer-forming cytoskeletal protein n=1 Tax=Terrilactibacillus laevilacticus TaxID=1380157 RepID=A0ABW5PPH1_9BACI|nr:polymer-forming cytoskeletal protein [Terrilactibacillus laevilacticus]
MIKTTQAADLIISGSGSTSGGIFRDVKISGSGKVSGDIECNQFQTSGSSRINGNVKSENMKISGSSKILGSVTSDTMDISGSTTIEGNADVKTIHISGFSRIKGNMKGERVSLSGGIKLYGSLEADSVQLKGGFMIQDLLNADEITIGIGGDCKVKEIGCGTLKVTKKTFGLDILGKLFSKHLITDQIEGDDIYLEYTKAKTVRGNRVTIGTGCEIDHVEYKDHFSKVGNAMVKHSEKI